MGFMSSPMITQRRGSSLPVKKRSYVVGDIERVVEPCAQTPKPCLDYFNSSRLAPVIHAAWHGNISIESGVRREMV
jgi:hypothetical protein